MAKLGIKTSGGVTTGLTAQLLSNYHQVKPIHGHFRQYFYGVTTNTITNN